MSGCILRVSGEEFAVDAFLAESSLEPYSVSHRGDVLQRASGNRVLEASSFKIEVSSADGDLESECADVLQFLRVNIEELARLARYPGVTDIRLDFAYYRRSEFLQCDYLSPELLMLVGSLRIGIELSLYPSDQEGSSR